MADLVVFNGTTYVIPTPNEEDWGQNVTDFLVAIPSGCLQNTGGLFTITADVDFGASFGLLSSYYKSRTASPASAGTIRLAKTDLIEWRNFAGGGNNTLGTNASDQLTYNGTPLEFNSLSNAHIFVGNVSNVATDVAMSGDIGITNAGVTAIQPGVVVNADVNASAAIAYTKLNLTGSVVNADIFSGAAIAYTKLNLMGSVVNADISTSAAIAYSKLAPLASSHVLVGSAGNVATDTALSGDATLANTGALTLATVNSNVGSFTLSNITVNAKGLITAASSTTTGNLTDDGTDGIVITSGTGAIIGSGTSIAQHVADATHNGYLSSTDWNTFNSKETATLTNTHIYVGNASNVATDVALSGDATLANTGALTLNTVNSNVGSFGSSTSIPNFTVNAKGLVTAAGSNVVIAPAGTLTGTTLASNVVTSSLTTVGTIGTGVWQGTPVVVTYGGTGLATLTAHDVLVGNGTGNVTLVSPSTAALALVSNGTSADPSFQAVVNSVTGTANQVITSAATGSITLSLPQSIATSSTPTFASETLTNTTNQLVLGTTRTVTVSATQPATSSRVYTIPDQGAAANFLLDQANYTIAGTWTFSNSITLASSKAIVFTDNTTNTVTTKATNSTTSWTLSLPTTAGSASQFLQTDGSGNTSWATPSGSGTVNAGTAPLLAFYATSTNAVSNVNADASMGSNKITNVKNPTGAQDAATKTYVDTKAGIINQLVQVTTTSSTSTTSTSYVDTALTASITPSATSSKIKISMTGQTEASTTGNDVFVTIARGGTNLVGANGIGPSLAAGTGGVRWPWAAVYLDSPASVSALTYTVRIKSETGGTVQFNDGGGTAIILLEEILQ